MHKRDVGHLARRSREFPHEPPLEYRIARQMAASWKNRQKAPLAERDKQLVAIEKTRPLGF